MWNSTEFAVIICKFLIKSAVVSFSSGCGNWPSACVQGSTAVEGYYNRMTGKFFQDPFVLWSKCTIT